MQSLTRFKWVIIIVTACMLASNLAAFLVMTMAIKQQQERVDDLFYVGISCKRMMEAAINTQVGEINPADSVCAACINGTGHRPRQAGRISREED